VKRVVSRPAGYPGGPEIEVLVFAPLEPEELPEPPVIVDES
jgi:hypothetical protein